jgi:23S rRNA (uracil1939-C5)-methyltransferase
MLENQFHLTVDSLVYEGNGIGRLPDGKVVFIPFVLPGEVVIAEAVGEKPGHIRARMVSVEKPHPQRIQPRCIHFGTCGGCHYQHIPYQLQLEFKREIFREQLQRLAGLDNPVIDAVIPSAGEWNYRNALQFGLNQKAQLCFSEIYENQPFPVSECWLPMAEIGKIWPLAEFEPDVDIERIEYRQNMEGDLMMVLTGEGQDMPELASEATISIVHSRGNEQLVMAGDSFLSMPVKDRQFQVSAASFFQTNFSGARTLADRVLAITQSGRPQNILDIYCGVGLFSAFLAHSTSSITGVEYSPTACEDYTQNLDEFDNVSLFQGRAESILPNLANGFDCMIVDPPRAGLRREVIAGVISHEPKQLIYISCNPATLARDAKHLFEAGYRLESSTLVDMFPQTFHLESVNIFSKSR